VRRAAARCQRAPGFLDLALVGGDHVSEAVDRESVWLGCPDWDFDLGICRGRADCTVSSGHQSQPQVRLDEARCWLLPASRLQGLPETGFVWLKPAADEPGDVGVLLRADVSADEVLSSEFEGVQPSYAACSRGPWGTHQS
jgi:hypothetical protein